MQKNNLAVRNTKYAAGQAVNQFGGLHLAVNNAGIGGPLKAISKFVPVPASALKTGLQAMMTAAGMAELKIKVLRIPTLCYHSELPVLGNKK